MFERANSGCIYKASHHRQILMQPHPQAGRCGQVRRAVLGRAEEVEAETLVGFVVVQPGFSQATSIMLIGG